MRYRWTPLALVLVACASEATTDLTGRDAGVRDTGPRDGGTVVTADAGFPDAGPRDAGFFDSGVRDSGVRDGGVRDAGSIDAGDIVECTVASDCIGGLVPFSLPTCPNSDWSCLAGSCTWDCERGGRTCTIETGPAGDDCVRCSDDPNNLVCPSTPCSTPPFSSSMIEHGGGCARLFSASINACQGEFAWLDEFGLPDRLCAVTPLPTGAIRAVLTCSFCQQQYMW